MKKKIIAGICIVLGIAIMVVPFYYHFHGQQETDKLMEQFEQSLEDDEDESEEEVILVSRIGKAKLSIVDAKSVRQSCKRESVFNLHFSVLLP